MKYECICLFWKLFTHYSFKHNTLLRITIGKVSRLDSKTYVDRFKQTSKYNVFRTCSSPRIEFLYQKFEMKVYLRLITHQLSYWPSFCTARPTRTCRFSGVFDRNTGSHTITMRWAAFGFIYRFWRAKGWRTCNTIHISVYYMNLLIKKCTIFILIISTAVHSTNIENTSLLLQVHCSHWAIDY